VEIVEKWKEKGENSRRGTCSCQWVGDGGGWRSAPGAIRENEVAGGRQAARHDMGQWHDISFLSQHLIGCLDTRNHQL
jgi:hypothetical protein